MTAADFSRALTGEARRIQKILDNLAIYSALRTLCGLGVFDQLDNGPATVDDLADRVAVTMDAPNLSRDYLERVLRVGWAHRWVRRAPDRLYHQDSVGQTLVTDVDDPAHTAVMCAMLRRRRVHDLGPSRRAFDRPDSAIAEPIHAIVRKLDVYEALHLLCALRIPDRLDDGPASLDDLYAWCEGRRASEEPLPHLSRDDLARLLRIGTSQEWVARSPAGFFQQTRFGQLLTSGPESMRPAVMMYALPPWRLPLATLIDTVCRGEPVALAGADTVIANAAHARIVAAFNASRSATMAATLADAIETHLADNLSHVVTIGGGAILLAEILGRLPHVNGVLVDWRDFDGAASHLARIEDLVGRWAIAMGHDMDTGIPAAFRPLYLISGVINTLHLNDVHHLLCRVATAMDRSGPHSVLWLVQSVLPDAAEPHPAFAEDLLQMTRTRHGRQRTLQEHVALLRKAGLRVTGAIDTEDHMIIVASSARTYPLTMAEWGALIARSALPTPPPH
ncbi:methyltransferase family protein [Nonomuraea jabiensis]|uniref:methyltransferase family protein n=1 Tax=Nonomuraea jabiensis TaxID=882448 RepID=UPI003D717E14